MFIAALFIIARTWKQPRCPAADEWIRKLWYIYTMEYYSAIKKNSFESVLMRWMKLEPIIQSEVSQKDKDEYSILTHIYRILKDGYSNPICKTEKRGKKDTCTNNCKCPVTGTQYKITRHLEMARQHVQKAVETDNINKLTADPEMRVTNLKKKKKTITIMFKELEATENFYKEPANY